MFVKINDVDVNATLISTFYKSEGEPYQITYRMLSGPILVEEFSNASDMNNKYKLVSEISLGSGGGGSSTNVYTYKGSCLFANLPVSDNEVGDVWNIEDDFTLDGKDYPAGTNVAWTGTNWDPLAGSSNHCLVKRLLVSESDLGKFHSYHVSTVSDACNQALIDVCNSVLAEGSYSFILIVSRANRYEALVYSCTLRPQASQVLNMSLMSSMDSKDQPCQYSGSLNLSNSFYFGGTVSGGRIVTLSKFSGGGRGKSRWLSVENRHEYTPTADYNPATKKYVDDSLLNIAPLYDATATYNLGDLVIYNALLYKCTTAVTTAEAWDSTHWTRTNLNTVLSSLTTPSGGGN